MKKSHRIYFFFWKILMRIKGVKEGTFFLIYSNRKQKFIKGVVTSMSGESVTDKKVCFDVGINWLEPIQGNDSRYYNWGSYSYKETLTKLKRLKKKDY